MTEDAQYQLRDNRDNKIYWISKLQDDRIWMTQNLDFDIDANTTLNSNTTDLNVAYDSGTGQYTEYNDGYIESNGIIYWTPVSSATTIDFEGTTVTGWQNNSTEPYSANKTDDTETGRASLGNYYNWTAAIASNVSSSLTQETLSDTTKNPQNSICPKGWRLPTISNQSETVAGSTNEFARLKLLYSSNDWRTSPLYFALSGAVNDTFGALNLYGFYWSSTVSTASSVYQMYFDSSTVYPSRDYYRNRGYSIRCIAR